MKERKVRIYLWVNSKGKIGSRINEQDIRKYYQIWNDPWTEKKKGRGRF